MTDDPIDTRKCASSESTCTTMDKDLSIAFTPSPLVSVAWLNDSGIELLQNDVNNTFPDELRFNENSLTVVIVYCVLFIIAAVGNLTVFITLFKSRHRKSRISLMITHLAVADLLVTFIMIPLEVGWRLTVQWRAGNLACKAFLFLRAFGLYLSSNVLVCVSLDRYFAILHPLRVNDARRRGKVMLTCAWIVSLLWSVPQSIVFHVSPHPKHPSFYQCVTFGFFSSSKQELAYNLFCVVAMYFFPLMVICVSYTAILCEISHKSRESTGDCYQQPANGRMRLRRSDMTNIERARSRTLKMTVTIVVVFVWCWTPYVVMTLWYMFDRESAARVANWIQDALFMMAVSNSCMNPLVYGSYAMNFRKEYMRCLSCIACLPEEPVPLGRKGTDFDAGAGQGGIKRRVIKCVFTLRKVGSGATRSTTMLHGVMRSPADAPQALNHTTSTVGNHHLLAKASPLVKERLERPPSMGQISLLSEPMESVYAYRPSFHSDPTGQSPFIAAERNVSNIELYSHNIDYATARPIL